MLRSFFFLGLGFAFAASTWIGFLWADAWVERQRAERLARRRYVNQRLNGLRP